VRHNPRLNRIDNGLLRRQEWMRTLELSSRTTGIEYRMILFDDLDVILPGFPGPSPDMLKKMYGNRIGGTHLISGHA
jgi:hypothetical protein